MRASAQTLAILFYETTFVRAFRDAVHKLWIRRQDDIGKIAAEMIREFEQTHETVLPLDHVLPRNIHGPIYNNGYQTGLRAAQKLVTDTRNEELSAAISRLDGQSSGRLEAFELVLESQGDISVLEQELEKRREVLADGIKHGFRWMEPLAPPRLAYEGFILGLEEAIELIREYSNTQS